MVTTADSLAQLLSPEGLALLSAHCPDEAADDASASELTLELRKSEHPAELVSAVVSQLALRYRARTKFGEFADTMFFTRAGLEQATRLKVAARHAQRFRAAGVSEVYDLGCGIGADAMALSAVGCTVTAVEADEATAALTTLNLIPFPESSVRHALAQDVELSEGAGVWLDPARRDETTSGTRRIFDPEAFSPPLSFVLELARTHPVGVKLGPGLPHDAVPEDAEAVWLSDGGDVVETVLYLGAVRRPDVRRAAVVVTDQGAAELTAATGFPGIDPEAATLGRGVALGEYLLEPDGAVIRAGLVADLGSHVGAEALDPHLAYLTSHAPVHSPFARCFRVLGTHPIKVKHLKAWARETGVSTLAVKKRGVDVVPETLRRDILAGSKLKRNQGRAATLVLARIGDNHVAIEVQEVTAS
ncbi:SAM-dependent methyltransferase [Galactobacter sp.]|uniref:class I SAM-dependent methyltransferase n=1 Tax=Galactobacter sp. TaxID=2676125 RepID=UPI0025C73E6B|nr:SAM-dependent methyltransferase [Galactobacter sp.]